MCVFSRICAFVDVILKIEFVDVILKIENVALMMICHVYVSAVSPPQAAVIAV